MSYARWSSDDFKSDVYCYPHVDGHYQLEISNAKSHLNLPYLGESFSFNTLKELSNKLTELRVLGYYVPDKAFKRIHAEVTSS